MSGSEWERVGVIAAMRAGAAAFVRISQMGQGRPQQHTGGSNSSGNSKVYYYCYYCLSESLRATALSAITG